MRNCKKVFKCLPVCALPDVTKYLPEKWAEEREGDKANVFKTRQMFNTLDDECGEIVDLCC